jgi:hypothetical protein
LELFGCCLQNQTPFRSPNQVPKISLKKPASKKQQFRLVFAWIFNKSASVKDIIPKNFPPETGYGREYIRRLGFGHQQLAGRN